MPWLLPTLLVASFALLLVAAKSHGRQVRLERELAGHMAVEFGRSNGPFVDALWRRDRWTFWPTWALKALVLVALVLVLQAPSWLLLVVVLLWAPAAGFAAAGLASARRFAAPANAPLRDEARRERAEWYAHAVRGSRLWWGATFALGLGVAALAVLWSIG